MRPRLEQNFRGLAALLVGVVPAGTGPLESALTRIGIAVRHPAGSLAAAELGAEAAHADLILVDTDALEPDAAQALAQADRPVVALVGHETPGRLVRAFELQPSAFLVKPVRAHGVFTAVFMAVNEHRRRGRQEQRLRSAEARLAARRTVVKAILRLMREAGLDDEEAYGALRAASMRRRMTVEEAAAQILASPEGSARTQVG